MRTAALWLVPIAYQLRSQGHEPQMQVKQLFAWLGLDYAPQTAAFLASSHACYDSHNRSVFMNPSVSIRWEKELDPAIAEAIEADLRGTPLATFMEDADA